MDGTPAVPADGPKSVPSTAVRKQPALKRSSGGASRPAGARKNSGAEYGSSKGQATVTFRRSLSQTEFTKDFDTGITGLQRPSKPVQLPVQLPLQLPAGKVQLTAVGVRKWLKIEASGSTSILQVAAFPTCQHHSQC